MSVLAVAILASLSFASALTPPPPNQATINVDPTAPFRIATLSDTHVIGPSYEIGSEGSDNDNLSILKTQQRLYEVMTRVNSINPAPVFAAFGGDVVHNAQDPKNNASYYINGFTGYNIAQSEFGQFAMPVYMTWGNHDYEVKCGSEEESFPKESSWEIFAHFFNATPYSSIDVGGWKYLLLDGQQGYTWNATDERCYSRYGSYGRAQLDWVAEQLSEGKPTIIHTHYPLPNTAVDEFPGSTYPDLLTTLLAFDNVKLYLSGHNHKGFNWEDLYPFTVYTLPAVRYDADNYFLLELTPNTDQWQFLDFVAKNKGGARCSYTYTYENGTVTQVVDAEELGDCGTPAFDQTSNYTLPTISNPDEIPDDFEPEKVCPVELIDPFLQACASVQDEAALAACCEIVNDIYRPSSGAPFGSCLCVPSFYMSANQTLTAMGGDLGGTVTKCISEFGGRVALLGTGSCKTPKYPAP